MKIEHSKHWIKKQKKKKKDITNDVIEYAIHNSDILKDKYWKDAFECDFKNSSFGKDIKSRLQKDKRNDIYYNSILARLKMKETWYDKKADILNIEINDKEYWKSIDFSPMKLEVGKTISSCLIKIFIISKFELID